MFKRLRSMGAGTRLMLAVFLFTAGYSAFQLVKGVATLNVHLIIGGVIFTAVSVLMILICWHGRTSDADDATTDGRDDEAPANCDRRR